MSAGTALRLPFRKSVLANRLTVIVSRNPAARLASVAAFCDVGVLCEPEEKAGLAHLAAALLDEGSRRRSGEEIAEDLEAMGAQLETGHSGASLSLPSEELGEGLRVLAELLVEPAFPERELRKKKEHVLSEILADEDDPKTKALYRFREIVYGRHPLHRPPHGYARTVSRIQRGDLLRFHRRFFAPERTILAVSGDVSSDRALRLVERHFGRWNQRAYPPPPLPAIAKPSRPRVHVFSEQREQANVFLGHLGICRTDPDFYRLLVLDHILGTGPGFTDRLSRKLRDEQGLAYTIYAGITSSAGKERGTFSAYVGTSPDRFARAVRGILRELREIRRRAPSAEEIRLAQDYLTGSYVLGLERNLSRATFLINQERFRLGDDYLSRYERLIRGVTADQLLAAARKHLDPDRYVLVAVGPVRW